jgi:hypothetical protein
MISLRRGGIVTARFELHAGSDFVGSPVLGLALDKDDDGRARHGTRDQWAASGCEGYTREYGG